MIYKTPRTPAELGENMQSRRSAFYRGRQRNRPRSLARAAIVGPLVVLALLGAASAAHASPRANGGRVPPPRTNADLAALASKIVGAPVAAVVCQDSDEFAAAGEGDAEGFVQFPDGVTSDGVIHLRTGYCALLRTLGLGTSGWQFRLPDGQAHVIDVNLWGLGAEDLEDGKAILFLVHEAEHVALSSLDEGAVECRALSTIPAAVRAFGVSGWLATRIQRGAREAHFDLAPEYQTAACPA